MKEIKNEWDFEKFIQALKKLRIVETPHLGIVHMTEWFVKNKLAAKRYRLVYEPFLMAYIHC